MEVMQAQRKKPLLAERRNKKPYGRRRQDTPFVMEELSIKIED